MIRILQGRVLWLVVLTATGGIGRYWFCSCFVINVVRTFPRGRPPSQIHQSPFYVAFSRRKRNRNDYTLTRKSELLASSSSSSSSSRRSNKARRRQSDRDYVSNRDDDDLNPSDNDLCRISKEDRRSQSWIMLVDDEESIRTAVGQLLQSSGYGKVTTCSDGSEAFQQLIERITDHDQNEQPDQKMMPDCLVTDLRMPVMDGIELIQRIRQQPCSQDDEEELQSLSSVSSLSLQKLAQMPIVILSAKSAVQDRIEGYDSGADGYLSKPFDPEELVAICDQVLERYEADTSLPITDNATDGTKDKSCSTNTNNGISGSTAAVQVSELKNDINEIKNLLLQQGGGGIGNGYIERTGIFLSKDERRILELLSDGLMTKEIASETHLSTRRIEQLLTRMFRKTDTRNRTELVRWAVSTGNVDRV